MNATVESLLQLGDDRLVLGHRLSELCGHAPTLEEDIALSNIALDLLGQASRLLALAGARENRGRDANALAFGRDPTAYRNCLLVEQPNTDFAHTIVRQVLFDAAALPELERLSSGSDSELAAIAQQAAKESSYHPRHARDWLLRLGDGSDESHRRAQRALDALWRFTPELYAGRAEIRSGLEALVERATLLLPDDPPYPASGGRRGAHTEHLDHLLSEMQCVARAHPGAQW